MKNKERNNFRITRNDGLCGVKIAHPVSPWAMLPIWAVSL